MDKASLAIILPSLRLLPALAMPIASTANITLPPGTSNHGDPNLLCKPANGYTVFSFILANYFTHAATTQTFPGESLPEQLFNFVAAFLYPASGVSRGLGAIARGITSTRSRKEGALREAAVAGALCMVVRTSQWRPVANHPLFGIDVHRAAMQERVKWRIHPPEFLHTNRVWNADEDLMRPLRLLRKHCQIHGGAQLLPKGYAYAKVPRNAVISSVVGEPAIHIAASINSAKIIIAIFQTIYSSYTLYEARGDQVKRYGYAAFSLTVAPYVAMSVINLLASLLMPSYPSVYIVRSEVMDELEREHGRSFDGTVGALVPLERGEPIFLRVWDSSQEGKIAAGNGTAERALDVEPHPHHVDPHISIPACAPFQCLPPIPIPSWLRKLNCFARSPSLRSLSLTRTLDLSLVIKVAFALAIAAGVPLSIIGGLSHFRSGDSTHAQQIWTMLWLGFGCIYGVTLGFRLGDRLIERWYWPYLQFLIRMVAAAPAIGGLVVVGQMIMNYGDCIMF